MATTALVSTAAATFIVDEPGPSATATAPFDEHAPITTQIRIALLRFNV
jgi:hypothetical protein